MDRRKIAWTPPVASEIYEGKVKFFFSSEFMNAHTDSGCTNQHTRNLGIRRQ